MLTAPTRGSWRRAAGAAAFLAALGCGTGAIRSATEPHVYPAGVAQMRWRTVVHAQDIGQSRPEECASGALVGSHLVLGSRAGRVLAVDTADGHTVWSTPVSGSVDGEARFDAGRKQVYVGTDDGYLYAMSPDDGAVRWSYKARGAIEQAPAVGPSTLYLATAANRLVALDSATGKSLWQYDRERPEGFTIHGYAGPRLLGDMVYAGFADGFLVALRGDSGEIVWSRSLAAASEQFVDVDATPGVHDGQLIAASYSGGLYALRLADGEVAWRTGVEGTSSIEVGKDRIYVGAPLEGLVALNLQGQVLWRQGLSQAGDLSAPQEVGPYLIFTGSRAGLFIVDRASGQLLQVFDPGRGMCAAPTIDPVRRELYVLANSGTLYALSLIW